MVCLFVALVAAGCGGSSSTKHTTSSSSGHGAVADSRAAFIAAADRTCKAAQPEQLALRKQAKTKRTFHELVPLLRRQGVIANALAGKLRAIPEPTADRGPIGRFIGSIRLLGTYSTALANAVTAGHTKPAVALKGKLLQARSQELALGRGYGFKVCASGVAY